MSSSSRVLAAAALLLLSSTPAQTMDRVRRITGTDEAIARYGVSGKGVTAVVMDRGIDWSHPDFRHADGSTRIKWLLDMSGQNLCAEGNPAPAEYSEAQINAALAGGVLIPSLDFVGHGNATAGSLAGNGRALASGRYRGMAPQADLVVVKVTSEGAPAAAGNPAETPFNGCYDQAFDWVDQKIDALGQPAVGIINIGTQAGPIDGTSALSRKIDEVFGLDRPGRVFVAPGGDEGGLPNHAGGAFSAAAPGEVSFFKESGTLAFAYLWYSGAVPAEVTVAFDGGEVIGPVAPGELQLGTNIDVFHYLPGLDPYPITSTSGDRSVGIITRGTRGSGTVTLQARDGGEGRFDLYTDLAGDEFLTANVTLLDQLVPGRLSDVGSTRGAIVSADFMNRTTWTDIDQIARSIEDQGAVDDLWFKSPAGPTRDGRFPGPDVTAPGEASFVTVSPKSFWGTQRGNLIDAGDGFYVRFGGNSGAAPIIAGAVALMLELDPTLTGREARDILRESAKSDRFTGSVPNTGWGYGKLDVLGALDRVACHSDAFLCLNGGRFSVKVDWRDPQGNSGSSQVVPFGSNDSGLLWFFNSTNWEMLVKVLDACSFNDRFWVFAAATTTVEYTLQVVDTFTGEIREYTNPQGRAADALTDINAFDTCDANSLREPRGSPSKGDREAPKLVRRSTLSGRYGGSAGETKGGQCLPGDENLCLSRGRFKVELEWQNPKGETGPGRRVEFGSDNSGLLWFFNSTNWEMLIKVLDGRSINGNFWVFAAATTNVQYTLKVTDTETGEIKEYFNPQGRSASALTDIGAFTPP